ncbi:N-acetylmuramoyl-L-alanine amidase [Paracoccus sp. Z118]|uniref:N-acetylmuramoyl-L-alanine amidase family protein n=1 Tax=Paracoccus sp. Z118 TaxID=2851017 RepID=UPI001C2C1660|nr:N-acetylmuramoyl-L-alanine amidase [Paracoccus sp. Z118]MBV0891531.1 N-acetylmuramoyl-L-alanine amidase [Paracoccus sp. Z118]
MDKQQVIEQLRAEIEATRARIDAAPEAAESLDRRGDDTAEFTAAEEVRYLEELRDDLEITEATLDVREIEAAADVEARESAGDGLAVVVGHTRSSPGAQGKAPPLPRNPDTARYEYTWNSKLAEMIKERADASGIRCSVFFRDSGGITGAYARVRQWRPEATVELHFNAFNERARGTETLFALPRSRAWAQALQDEFVALYERRGSLDRGLKDRSGGGRGHLSLTQIAPSALIEPFFGDEASDAELGERTKERLAESIIVAFGKIRAMPLG